MKHNTASTGAMRAILLYAALAAVVVSTQLGASTSIKIASNPVYYGQNDKITASTSLLTDPITLYINSTIVANSTGTANYTICQSGPCLLPGSYAITAIDLTNRRSAVQSLVVKPQYPTFSVQLHTVKYGRTDIITTYAGSYNDTLGIVIDGVPVLSGIGDISYTICGNATQGEPCLPIGMHSVGVVDTTEGVSSITNDTINVTPSAPSVSLQRNSAPYGAEVNVTVSAPVATDQVSIMYGTTTLATGTGSFTYTICNASASNGCLPPATYSIYAYDLSENINSTARNLTITQRGPLVTIGSTVVEYGAPDRISVTAQNINDGIVLAIDGRLAAQGTGNLSYTVCNSIYNTACIPAGKNIVSVSDTAEGYTSNYTITVTPVLPSIDVIPLASYSGKPVTINGTAPYFSDNLTILIDGSPVENGTGLVEYTACQDNQLHCLPPGTYRVLVYDGSENVSSTAVSLAILSPGGSASTLPTTSMSTSTIPAGSKVPTTAPSGVIQAGGLSSTQLITVVVIAAILLAAFLFLKSRL